MAEFFIFLLVASAGFWVGRDYGRSEQEQRDLEVIWRHQVRAIDAGDDATFRQLGKVWSEILDGEDDDN